MCSCVVISYSSVHSSNIFMPRFTIVTTNIYLLLMVMYYQYIRTYNTCVSMRVKFNLNISILNSDNRTNITLRHDGPIRQSLTSFLLLLRVLSECRIMRVGPHLVISSRLCIIILLFAAPGPK